MLDQYVMRTSVSYAGQMDGQMTYRKIVNSVPMHRIAKVRLSKLLALEKPPSILTLEISSILRIDQDEVKVVADRELLVDIPERWGQVESAQKQPDRNSLPWDTTARSSFLSMLDS